MTPPPRYTQKQRDAITTAVLDGECSVLEALRRAQAGALPGIDRFRMNKDAAYRAVQAARTQRDGNHARERPLEAIPNVIRDLLAASIKEARRLEKTAKHGQYDATAIRDVTKNIQELHKILRYADPTSPENKTAQHPALPAQAQKVDIAQLVQPNDTTHAGTGHDTGSLVRA